MGRYMVVVVVLVVVVVVVPSYRYLYRLPLYTGACKDRSRIIHIKRQLSL